MKLDEIFNESEDYAAQLKELQKELISAKSGGNDDVAAQLKIDIEEMKEMIKDAAA